MEVLADFFNKILFGTIAYSIFISNFVPFTMQAREEEEMFEKFAFGSLKFCNISLEFSPYISRVHDKIFLCVT